MDYLKHRSRRLVFLNVMRASVLVISAVILYALFVGDLPFRGYALLGGILVFFFAEWGFSEQIQLSFIAVNRRIDELETTPSVIHSIDGSLKS